MPGSVRIARLRVLGWWLLPISVISLVYGWVQRSADFVQSRGGSSDLGMPSVLVTVGHAMVGHPSLVGMVYVLLGSLSSAIMVLALTELCAGARKWTELACIFLVGVQTFAYSTLLVYQLCIHPKYAGTDYPVYVSMILLRYSMTALILVLAWAAYARMKSTTWMAILVMVTLGQEGFTLFILPHVVQHRYDGYLPALVEVWRYITTDEYANISSLVSSDMAKGAILELVTILDSLLFLVVPVFLLAVRRKPSIALCAGVSEVRQWPRATDKMRVYALTLSLVVVFFVCIRTAAAMAGHGWGTHPNTIMGTLWLGVTMPLALMFMQVSQADWPPQVAAALVLGALSVPALYWAAKALVLSFWPGRESTWTWKWGVLSLIALHVTFVAFLWH